MKREEILALLQERFGGVRRDALDQLAGWIAITAGNTEDEAREAIGKYAPEAVEAFARDYRARVDREVTEAGRKIEARLRSKLNPSDEGAPHGGGETSTERVQDTPERDSHTSERDVDELIRQAVERAVQPLADELARYRTEHTTRGRGERLQEALRQCRDEAFRSRALRDFGRMSFETDEDFDAYLHDLEGDVEAVNQAGARSALLGAKPLGARTPKADEPKASPEEIDEVLRQMNQ